MSWNPTLDPHCPEIGNLNAIETIIIPRSRDLGGFEHHGRQDLPLLDGEGKSVRLIIGNAWGETAPVRTFSEMFYADVLLERGASIPLPENHEDRGVYVTSGSINVAGQDFAAGQMMVFRPGDKIEAAKVAWAAGDWAHGRFQLPPDDNDEFIPLPEA
ncbi:pirin-like C-terminal cupin domain-containing protein [Aestuariibius sp. HNIBRBA575]|uniref:pirin-like C-terminal cupin domain-containing protein n=1 Tax=Aestuariibius sp. HNIBRBA575 TaxID=3233343 RepID=UPI0034A4E952